MHENNYNSDEQYMFSQMLACVCDSIQDESVSTRQFNIIIRGTHWFCQLTKSGRYQRVFDDTVVHQISIVSFI